MAIPIPAAIDSLIISKRMVGDNRPTYEVTIGGAPSSGDLTDPSVFSTWRDLNTAGTSGNVAETADGRAVTIYVVNDTDVKLAFADNIQGILDGSLAFDYANAVTLLSGLTGGPRTSINLIDGKLCAVICYFRAAANSQVAEFWQDSDGNGTNMAKVCDICTDITSDWAYSKDDHVNFTSLIHKLGNGNYVVMLTRTTFIYQGGQQICYSTNQGQSWIKGTWYRAGSGDHLPNHRSKSFLLLDDDSFVTTYSATSTSGWMDVWTNSGANRAGLNYGADWGGAPWNLSFINVQEDAYLVVNDGINYVSVYRLLAETPATTNITNKSDWEFIVKIPCDNYHTNHFFVLTADALTIQHDNAGKITGAGTLTAEVPLNCKGIEVDMSKGMASNATVVLDNKDGCHSPDKEGNWYHVINPNHTVTIKLGYGDTLQQVFTGLIDTVTMRAYPAEIEANSRDMLKRCLDQTVAQVVESTTYYNIYYDGQTAEAVFADLAAKAGWAAGDIVTGTTGMTLYIQFSHESYADAMQRLCELTGFEFYCDYAGKIHFQQATDRSPAITAASTVLTGTTATEIAGIPAGHPMVDGSVVVTSSDGLTTYSATTDYEVILGGSTANAAIKRRVGSTIADGATVLASCVYAHWVFREGQDVTRLDYTISDQEVQARVIVLAQDSGDAYVRGDYDYGGVRYYDVLAGKVQIVDAGEIASTAEQCAAIAARVGAASLTKVRQANFECIGNPYIEVGDCIQVIESSTTISEIYRVYAVRHTMEPGRFLTTLETYHYGYAPV